MRLVVALLALALAGCTQGQPKAINPPGETMDARGRNAFDFDFPETVTVAARPGALDFKVYDLSVDGVVLVGVYVGDYPDFPTPADTDDQRETKRITSRTLGQTEHLWSTSYDWPSRLHVWTVPGLTEGQASRARALADSVRPTAP